MRTTTASFILTPYRARCGNQRFRTRYTEWSPRRLLNVHRRLGFSERPVEAGAKGEFCYGNTENLCAGPRARHVGRDGECRRRTLSRSRLRVAVDDFGCHAGRALPRDVARLA